MNYSIIDSIKGGSGKTCFALNHALYLNMLEKSIACDKCADRSCCATCKVDKDNPALYIDVDFVGTSLESILFNDPVVGKPHDDDNIKNLSARISGIKEDGVSFIKDNGQICIAKKYFNSILDADLKYNELITKLDFPLTDDTSAAIAPLIDPSVDSSASVSTPLKHSYLDIIISSPDYNEKLRFRGTKSTEINVSNFKFKLCALLKNIPTNVVKAYKNIVLDMPPGAERFAASIYDIFLNLNSNKLSKIKLEANKDKLNIFHMTTHDVSHIDSTVENICNFYTSGIHREIHPAINIFIVVNDIYGKDIHTNNMNGIAIMKKIKEKIMGKLSIPNNIYDKIHFIMFPYNEKYRESVLHGLTPSSLSSNCLSYDKIKNTYEFIESDGKINSMIYKYINVENALPMAAKDVVDLFK